jgi:hypothetical protein
VPLARQSWAAQLAAALQGIGMPADLAWPRPLCLEQLKRSALRRHQHEIQAAAGRPGASKLAHYLAAAWGGQLPGAEEYVPLSAAYLGAVLQCSCRVALALAHFTAVKKWHARLMDCQCRLQAAGCSSQ